LQTAKELKEEPLRSPGETPPSTSEAFNQWHSTNVRPQRQEGYSTVTATLPLGDITAGQLRALADIVRRFTRETIRTTVEQNFVIRWVSNRDLVAIYEALHAVGLGEPGAGTIVDIVTCPGTDTCKLGISSSRGLAAELRNRLARKSFAMDRAVQRLHIKISGCFNSCGQHHVADLGFYGVSRKMAGYAVPHFQVVLGGEWENNAGSYGLPVVAVPSKNIPQVVTRLTDRYVANRKNGESFQDFVKRVGKVEIKSLLEDLTRLPADDSGQSFFSDWGDPREYSLGDMGVGECAGEVVAAIEFDLAAAESEVFEAQVDLEKGRFQQAARTAYLAMLHAAKALVKLELQDVPDDPDRIIREFTARFYDTQKFFDTFAGGKFAQYLFVAHAASDKPATPDSARYMIDEAQLFIDASHACYSRLGAVSVV
jgi:sulfite reductase (ferredoxin)